MRPRQNRLARLLSQLDFLPVPVAPEIGVGAEIAPPIEITGRVIAVPNPLRHLLNPLIFVVAESDKDMGDSLLILRRENRLRVNLGNWPRLGTPAGEPNKDRKSRRQNPHDQINYSQPSNRSTCPEFAAKLANAQSTMRGWSAIQLVELS